MKQRQVLATLTALALALSLLPLAAGAAGQFSDDDGNVHESAIERIAALGITRGCNPPTNDLYCPSNQVTRGQMAAFMVRAFGLTDAGTATFTDTTGHVFAGDINILANAGITRGCNPPDNTRFCPDDTVTRGQMAAFLVRALGLIDAGSASFTDTTGHVFAGDINILANAGITRGCNPPDNTRFCPDDPVLRDQMATFLSRAYDIHTTGTTTSTIPPTTGPTTSAPSTTTPPPTTTPPVDECVTSPPTQATIVSNPYSLDFSSNSGGLCDHGTVGTGFTWVDDPSEGSGYQRNLLDVTGGELRVTSTAGLFEGSSNDQDNALAVPLNPQITYQLDTRIVSPPQGSGGFEQGGLWFGNDEDNYVKVVVLSNAGGIAVQTRAEINGSIAGSRLAQLGAHPSSIELRLVADHAETTVQGQYRLNGSGTFQDVGTAIGVPTELFTIDQAGTTTNTFGGILTSHRTGPSPVTYRFDSFRAEGSLSTIACQTTGGVSCAKTRVPYEPSSMLWHGDRLYVLNVCGVVHRYNVSGSGALSPDGSYSPLPKGQGTSHYCFPASGGGIYTALGMAIEPGSSTSNPTVWIATSLTGGPNFLQGIANSSTVWRIPNIASGGTATAMVTGLPRAYENHAINSIHFHPQTQELYIAQGGNTGAGSANDEPGSAFGTRPEQPLAAAWLKAGVLPLNQWSPTQDGNCATPVDDDNPGAVSKVVPNTCSVDVVATGLRNMYDFVFHSNGNAYGPDNGLGVNGTVPIKPTPDCRGLVHYDDGMDPGPQPDRLQLLQWGNYYGHPNPSRDECVFFAGNFQGAQPLTNYVNNYQQLNQAQGQSPRSLNSVIEYKNPGHPWHGDMLITAFGGPQQGLFRFDLAETCDANQSAYNNGCFPREGPALGQPLGVTQISNGRVVVGEWIARQNINDSFLVVMTPPGA